MKKNINLVVAMAITLAATMLSGCKKDFLDINDNPNSPERVDVIYALPSAQAWVGYTVGNQLAIYGNFWSQYWTQGPNGQQYADVDRYFYNSAEANNPWSQLYAGGLADLDFVIKDGLAKGKHNHAAIGYIMKAYTHQLIADAWGASPLSEAIKGSSNKNITPKFDSEEQVYDQLIQLVDSGLFYLDPAKPAVGNEDIVFQGDLNLWYKFANTLKLKIYMRQVNVRPATAQAGIASLEAAGAAYLDINDHDAFLKFTNDKFSQNPLYTTGQALGVSSNIFGSNTIIGYLNDLGDPRVADYFDGNGGGNIIGIDQGEGKLLPAPQLDASFSKPSAQVLGAVAPVRLISVSESYFLQAEAVARGYMGGSDQDNYETGIYSSWLNWENSGPLADAQDFTDYLATDSVAYPAGGGLQDKLKFILTQKWIAMCANQGFEAWCESRRTGYPLQFKESATSIFKGTNQFPQRFQYPSDESNTNPNVPAAKTINEKLWWAK